MTTNMESTAIWLRKLQLNEPDEYRRVFASFLDATKGMERGGRGQRKQAPTLALLLC